MIDLSADELRRRSVPVVRRAGGGRRARAFPLIGCRSASAGGITFWLFFHMPAGISSYSAACVNFRQGCMKSAGDNC